MFRRNPLNALLFGSLVAFVAPSANAELMITVSPDGPNSTLWSFSGTETATGFGFFNNSDSFLEGEPVGTWGGFPNFTTLNGAALSTFDSSVVIDVDGVVNTLKAGYIDDGATGNPDNSIERIGFSVNEDPGLEFTDGSVVSFSGSVVMVGAGIDAYSEGGLSYSGASTAFGNEPNNLPLTLNIVPEPGACVLALAAWGACAVRRRQS